MVQHQTILIQWVAASLTGIIRSVFSVFSCASSLTPTNSQAHPTQYHVPIVHSVHVPIVPNMTATTNKIDLFTLNTTRNTNTNTNTTPIDGNSLLPHLAKTWNRRTALSPIAPVFRDTDRRRRITGGPQVHRVLVSTIPLPKHPLHRAAGIRKPMLMKVSKSTLTDLCQVPARIHKVTTMQTIFNMITMPLDVDEYTILSSTVRKSLI